MTDNVQEFMHDMFKDNNFEAYDNKELEERINSDYVEQNSDYDKNIKNQLPKDEEVKVESLTDFEMTQEAPEVAQMTDTLKDLPELKED